MTGVQTCALPISLLMCHARPAATQPRRVDPLQGAGIFTLFGQMSGREGLDQNYGAGIYPIGDCNHDGLNDWLVFNTRSDTAIQHFFVERLANQLLLYHGKPGGLPSVEDGVVVGVPEPDITHQFLASGDWDADGNLDLAIRTFRYNDSIYGTKGGDQYTLVIFWGNANKAYSISDTSHLMIEGADAWGPLTGGVVGDFNMDGVQDFMTGAGNSSTGWGRLIGGETISSPTLHLFLGHKGKRWGRDGIGRIADWTWWQQPAEWRRYPQKLIDVDCDNAPDLVLFNDAGVPETAQITVVYGQPEQVFPDSSNIEVIDFAPVNGKYVRLMDVTADDVLDVVCLAGRGAEQRFLVWVAEPGERVSETVGDFSNPWAAVPTTNAIHDGFGDLGEEFYDLGDVNNDIDGFREIWAWTPPFFLCYNTGVVFDSIADGYYRLNGTRPRDVVNLGDIDGSGETTWAVGQYLAPGTVSFFKSNLSIRVTGTFRRLPHERYVSRCSSTVSVPEAEEMIQSASLDVVAFPNPSTNEVTVQWNPAARQHGEQAVIRVTDNLGKEVIATTTSATDGGIVWTAGERLPNGTYHITVTIQKTTDTATIILQR